MSMSVLCTLSVGCVPTDLQTFSLRFVSIKDLLKISLILLSKLINFSIPLKSSESLKFFDDFSANRS